MNRVLGYDGEETILGRMIPAPLHELHARRKRVARAI